MFEKITLHTPRTFVPDDLNAGDWAALAPLFEQLEQQLSAAADAVQLEQAILNWEELSAAIAEESSKRTIAMTCQTDDKTAEQAYLDFVEQIEPEVKTSSFRLAKALADHPHRDGLPAKRYEVFTRDTALEVELFRRENVALETETTKLGQQYQKLIGSLAVPFDGEERTLVQMGRYLEETDRARRQEAWELVANRRLEEAEKIDGQLDDLAKLRNQMSANAGFPNYRDFAHRRSGRFDYTPDDCLAFHDAIEQEMVPLLKELHDERQAALGIESVRPWDTATDPQGRPPLKPFEEVPQLIRRTQAIFDQLDGDLASWFR
ncbi:MAG: M3 family metallopeptidase, partial [Pedosphaera sp.]|nr:M3 family metallopeptidase [Pedosphaera sp.]